MGIQKWKCSDGCFSQKIVIGYIYHDKPGKIFDKDGNEVNPGTGNVIPKYGIKITYNLRDLSPDLRAFMVGGQGVFFTYSYSPTLNTYHTSSAGNIPQGYVKLGELKFVEYIDGGGNEKASLSLMSNWINPYGPWQDFPSNRGMRDIDGLPLGMSNPYADQEFSNPDTTPPTPIGPPPKDNSRLD